MLVDQSKKKPIEDLFDKYYKDDDFFLTFNDIGGRQVETEVLKKKISDNIEKLAHFLADVIKYERDFI